jgi:hypothetical protein
MSIKQAVTNFEKDLQDPSAGLHSGLYNTLAPVLSSKNTADAEGLKEQVRQGLVGLEYLTGAKKNKVNTFFDEHPIEATTTDLLGKSPLIGALLAGGGMLSNYRNRSKNFANTMMAEMARSKNPKDATNPENLLKSDREDVARILGGRKSPERLALIDRLNKTSPGSGLADEFATLTAPDSTAYERASKKYKGFLTARKPSKEYAQALKDYEAEATGIPKDRQHVEYIKNLKNRVDLESKKHQDKIRGAEQLSKSEEKLYQDALKKHQEKLEALFQKADISAEGAKLKDYTNLHESFKKLKDKGGIKKYFGEGLHDSLGDSGIAKFIKENILPQKGQAAIDLIERHGINAAHPNLDKDLLTRILAENDLTSQVSPRALETFLDPAKQKSSILNYLRKHRFPLYLGAGTAAAGTGLYHLMKAIQNQRYPEEQQKEWKRNALKAQGKFREAERI